MTGFRSASGSYFDRGFGGYDDSIQNGNCWYLNGRAEEQGD
jgi:hypothetical protein